MKHFLAVFALSGRGDIRIHEGTTSDSEEQAMSTKWFPGLWPVTRVFITSLRKIGELRVLFELWGRAGRRMPGR